MKMRSESKQSKLINNEGEPFFYYKDKTRKIVPCKDEKKNKESKEILKKIFEEHKKDIPKIFRENWKNVKLYDPKGNPNNAHSLILNPHEGAYDLNNKLNHMTGKKWTIFSCSWFIFNALKKDLNEEKAICGDSDSHPATYSPTMMEEFIKFFTKEGMNVLDPFAGIGSTLVGCKRTGRIGYGIELNKKYYDMIIKRVPKFKDNIILGDSRNVKKYFKNTKFNFCISSPPYWDVLNRSTRNFEKKRTTKNLDIKYSDSDIDLGNINNYNKFVEDLSKIYLDIYDLLEKNSYIVIIVKNVKKGGKFYPLAWDIAKSLSHKYELKDEKIWIQDKAALAPYGYPYSWAANILHHYCIILRKEND